MKRSNEPLAWALFGAGGMLSALFGPVLIFVTGIAVPLGLWLPSHTLAYAHVLAFAQHPLGKLAALAVISLFLFHAGHRILHSLHDLGLHTGSAARVLCYGLPVLATGLCAVLLLGIGF